MNHEGMEGSVIVITGGGSGMGAAMAKDFAERGAGIAILDLDEARGSAVADSITDILDQFRRCKQNGTVSEKQ